MKITTFSWSLFSKNLVIDAWKNPKYASENFKYESF